MFTLHFFIVLSKIDIYHQYFAHFLIITFIKAIPVRNVKCVNSSANHVP